MRQVLCPVLIGRDSEVGDLLETLGRAVDGSGAAVVVVGEPGVGKSRLIREAVRRAQARDMLVLTGRCVAGGVQVPFRPLAEALLGGLRERGPIEAPELRPFHTALGRLVPEWRSEHAAPALDSVMLAEGFLRLLHQMAGGHGCLLVVEDLQWADPETLTVLEYLADNVANLPIMCLSSVRAAEASSGLDLAATLANRRAIGVVELARLSHADAVRVGRACLDADVLPTPVEEVLRHAEGVPFLVEELLAGLLSSGELVERDGQWSAPGPVGKPVPPTFADSVSRRLAALPALDRDVVRGAAVLGRRFDWSLLSVVTGLDDGEVVEALRRAVVAQLLTAESDGFRFRHALTREAILDGLMAPERAELASRALVAVEQAHPDLPDAWCELAADLAEATDDRARAARLLLESGRRAIAVGALSTAEATLGRARRLAPADPALTMPIDEALTEVLALAGNVEGAFELGERLLGRLDLASHLPRGPAELHLRLARAAIAAGRWSVVADHLNAVRTGGLGKDAVLGARLNALEAQVALGRGRLVQAAQLADSSLAVAERAAAAEVACEALEVSGRIARQRGLAAAEDAFTRQLAVATAHGKELWRLRAMHELGTIDQLRTESVERLRQTRDLAVEQGALALVATVDLQIAAGLVKQFRPDEAIVAAQRSAVASRRLHLATLPMALVCEAAAYAQQGKAEAMEERLDEALTLAPDDLDVRGSAWGHCRATASLLAEDRSQAVAEMTTGAELLQQAPNTVAPPFLGLRVLLLAVDGAATASTAARRLRATAEHRHELIASLLGYADAVLLGRSRSAADASAAFAGADSSMGPFVAWYQQYARRLVAEAALTDGWGTPVPWLREAAAFFADRHDDTIAAACRAQLRRAGVRVPRPGRAGTPVPAQLRGLGVTRRETDVLELLAEGLTNAELGARLHLSPRTVEKHVSSLLAKTGCRRRGQLSGYSARLFG